MTTAPEPSCRSLLGMMLMATAMTTLGCDPRDRGAKATGDSAPTTDSGPGGSDAATDGATDGQTDGANDGATPPPPGCGDGVREGAEACDDGPANSDVNPDACRSDCSLPRCGDGVVDSGEACDDAGAGACRTDCAGPTGATELEPNDTPADATPVAPGGVEGALSAGETDCLSVTMPACAALRVTQTDGCGSNLAASLRNPSGALVAVGLPDGDGCVSVDPATAAGARFMPAGPHSLCLGALETATETAVPRWALTLTIEDSPARSFSRTEDIDGDGQPATCDEDLDGDGVLNLDDNCPTLPNGPGPDLLRTSGAGFFRDLLVAGPFTGTTSPDRCQPSADSLVASPDADASPVLGTAAGSQTWRALHSLDDRIELLTDFGGVSAPREVYAAVYLRSPTPRSATLALGPDDGARAWLDGVQVLEISSCQGTNVDQFQAAITLTADWQLLLLKIRDQGGGFGTYARLLDSSGAPLTDLELALAPEGVDALDQTDTDGDGIGDACDPTP